MNNAKKTTGTLVFHMLAMLLCVSLFVGSTFAWYVLSVTNSDNKIQVGNLDITVLDGEGSELKTVTENETEIDPVLFNGVSWRPGTVAYENLTLRNDGNLPLDYEIALAIKTMNHIQDSDEDTTNDKSLKDVLKVAVLEGHVASEEENSAVIEAVSEWKSMESFLYKSSLEKSDQAAEGSDEKKLAVIIYWKSTDEDSTYNVSAAETSDGQTLFVELGLQVTATQTDPGSDTFGNTNTLGNEEGNEG